MTNCVIQDGCIDRTFCKKLGFCHERFTNSDYSEQFGSDNAALLAYEMISGGNPTKEVTKPKVVPQNYEWEALWTWHMEREYEAADKRLYSEAEKHKNRRDAIRKMLDEGKIKPAQ